MKDNTTSNKQNKNETVAPVIDRQTLAHFLGLSEVTISRRVREGMPCVQRGSQGRAWQFDLAACVDWNTKRAVEKAIGKAVGKINEGESKAELDRRLLIARVTREEVEAAKAADEVVMIEEVEKALALAFVTVRQAMLTLPDRLGLRLLAAEDEIEIKEILRDEIELALHTLSETDLLEGFNDSIQ